MKPRLCFVGHESLAVLAPEFSTHGIGGESVQHALLARALRERGYPVSMIVGDFGQPDGASWSGVRTFRSFRAGDGLPLLRFAHPRWTGLWDAARRADADIYYVSCAGMQVGELALFARRHGRRVVFRVASDTDCQPGRHLIERDRLGIRHALHRGLYEYGLRRAHAVLAQSRLQQESLRRNYGIDAQVAPLLVERPQRIRGSAQRDVDVLWVGNLRQLKRPDRLLELAAAMPDLRFAMIGGRQPGADALYESVERAAGNMPNLQFLGPLPYHAVGAWFARARLLVNTSEIEGFPNTYLQAWVHGTPVIATFDPDALIASRGLGIAVSTPGALGRAVRQLALDAGAWSAASARCVAHARDALAEERLLAPYREVFEGLHRLARAA